MLNVPRGEAKRIICFAISCDFKIDIQVAVSLGIDPWHVYVLLQSENAFDLGGIALF